MRRFVRSASFAAALLAAPAVSVQAQGTGRSLDIDPSVRAAAMGGASNAVFWDEITNHWGNPAHLGYQRGLSYEFGRTQLVPGLATDVYFTTNVVKFGGAGLGVALSGKPGVGGIHLSYGESQGADEQGNPTGTFEAFEDVDAWSFGLSVARLTEAASVLLGYEPTIVSRYADFSFGMTGKKLEMQLAPTALGGRATTDAKDYGFLVRVSPSELIPGVRDVLGLDLAYGKSELSYESDPVVFLNEDQAYRVSEHERRGYAARVSLDWPGLANQMAGPAWIWEGLQPLVSFGYADDHSRIGVAPSALYETDGNGWEITLANVLSFRQGHYEDLLGDIDGDTGGWGMGIPIGTIAGVRYDYATFPQAQNSGLRDLKRRSASAWVDAVRVWRMVRRGG